MHLEKILNGGKPFRRFKDALKGNKYYLNKWYEHKNAAYIEHVKDQLEMYNNSLDDPI